ncbi:MAG TPA: hypothetical protein VGJ91_07375 [Polyangiaceae bacterium]
MHPPRGYEGPRKPPPAEPRSKLDSLEISAESLLDELAKKNRETEELRRALDAANRSPRGGGSLTPPPDRKAFLKLALQLGGALVLLMGAATAWLSAHTANVEAKVDRVEVDRKLDKVVTDPLPEKVQTNERDATGCKAWARATDDYYRQVFGKLGVSIPQQPNALPITPIETRAPKHKPNAVTGAPVLEVLTPPPALP